MDRGGRFLWLLGELMIWVWLFFEIQIVARFIKRGLFCWWYFFNLHLFVSFRSFSPFKHKASWVVISLNLLFRHHPLFLPQIQTLTHRHQLPPTLRRVPIELLARILLLSELPNLELLLDINDIPVNDSTWKRLGKFGLGLVDGYSIKDLFFVGLF